MMQCKTISNFIFMVLTALALSGCITEHVIGDYKDRYKETVSSVLISEDGKSLVVIGNEYHYVFSSSSVVIRLLKSKIHDKVVANFSTFEVDENNVITGHIGFEIAADLTSEEAAEAFDMGFRKKYYNSERSDLYLYSKLYGKRYQANEIGNFPTQYRLNKDYQVEVIAEQSKTKKAFKALASPITIAADGVVLLVVGATTIALAPITFPMIYSGLHRHN